MNALEVHSIEIVDEGPPMQLVEVLECVHIERAFLLEMVDAGVVSPIGRGIEQWQFARTDLRRLRRAQRLVSDLNINLSGAALVLDLLEERDALLKRLHSVSGIIDDL